MEKPTDIGMNRTGIKASPIDSKKTIEGAANAKLDTPQDGSLLEAERIAWSEEAEPVGTMPPPGSITGAVKATAQKLTGKEPNVFLDKIGERLAFERTGVRLYDALLCKLEAAEVHQGSPTRAELEQIRDQELRHFGYLKQALESLGGDPTAMTPSADLAGVAASGILKVLTDPRTTLTQCLDAILIAELADNDAWSLLVQMASGLGKTELSESFRRAMEEEEDHLAHVRRWVASALTGQAGIAPTTPSRPPAPPTT